MTFAETYENITTTSTTKTVMYVKQGMLILSYIVQ